MLKRTVAAALIGSVLGVGASAANVHTPLRDSTPSNTLLIRPFSMRYRVLRSGWDLGTAVFSLVPHSGIWIFHSEAHATGLAKLFVHATFKETTRFKSGAEGLRPLHYTYSDSGNKGNDEKIFFNWAKRIAVDKKGKHTRTFNISAGTQDRLTAQLMLSIQLLKGRSTQTTYTVIGGGKRNKYRIVLKRSATVATPAGNFHTVVVAWSNPKKAESTTFWMAPELQYLPVKMTEKKKGKATLSFVLSQYKGPRTKLRSASDTTRTRAQ